MSGPDDSRRAFLTGGTVVAASAAFAADASAQSKMVINDPNVVREIEPSSPATTGRWRATTLPRSTAFSSTARSRFATGTPKTSTAIRKLRHIEVQLWPPVWGQTVSVRSSPPTAMILRPCPRYLDARNRGRSAGRCRPGCGSLKVGASSRRMSAPSTSRRIHNWSFDLTSAELLGCWGCMKAPCLLRSQCVKRDPAEAH